MSASIFPQALSNIQAITPYVPGKPIDALKRELGLSDVIKLASNENPFGYAPKVKIALEAAINDSSRYPDGNGFRLKAALSQYFSAHGGFAITPDSIVVGNGSNDVLDLAGRVFLTSGDAVVMSEYCFAVYPLVAQAANAKAIVVPTHDFVQDLSAMSDAVKIHNAKLLFLANPNNPTGVWHEMHTIKRWIESIPNTCVIVLDEAYTEFLAVDNAREANASLSWLEEHPNLIITRSFSKIYGLGGLRVGYALAHPVIADWMNRLRQPFNVSNVALAAAEAALVDEAFIHESRTNNTQQMAVLEAGLHALALRTIPSRGNFLTFQVANAADLNQNLLQAGIIVRPLSSYGMKDWLRVTIGTPSENTFFLAVLKKLLEH